MAKRHQVKDPIAVPLYLFNELKFAREKVLFEESSFEILFELDFPGLTTICE